MLAPLLLIASSASAPAQPARAPSASADPILVRRDTPIRLMVLNEVSTRTAKPGDRFPLRVDQPLVVDGATIISIGAKAWGEVLRAEESGPAGKAGKLSARLVSVEVGGRQVPVSGETGTVGEKGTRQIALGAMGLGPFALLARGNNARLKAGEIFNAYLPTDMQFDRATGTLTPLKPAPATE